MASHEMAPLLRKGTLILFRRARHVKRGDVVLVDHPEFGTIIRKVFNVGRRGGVTLRACLNANSSIRELGSVDPALVRGRMVARIGWLPRL